MKQYVFRLDVSVDDITVMHELNGMTDLFKYIFYFLLWKAPFILEVIVDIPTTA